MEDFFFANIYLLMYYIKLVIVVDTAGQHSVFACLLFKFNFKLLFIFLLDISIAIKCYRCTVGPTYQSKTQQLCQKFEETDDYVLDCPYSTMCMKKVYRLQLLDGKTVETVSRDCAKQKYSEQVNIKRHFNNFF